MDIEIFTRINLNQKKASKEDVAWLCDEICKMQAEIRRLKTAVAHAGDLLYPGLRKFLGVAPDKKYVENLIDRFFSENF